MNIGSVKVNERPERAAKNLKTLEGYTESWEFL
jgi:nucleoid DNA-binding protein